MSLSADHEAAKSMRQRGSQAPNHLASVAYLKALDAEMEKIRRLLAEAWTNIDSANDFRKCSRHMDAAQQRLHRVIKRLRKHK